MTLKQWSKVLALLLVLFVAIYCRMPQRSRRNEQLTRQPVHTDLNVTRQTDSKVVDLQRPTGLLTQKSELDEIQPPTSENRASDVTPESTTSADDMPRAESFAGEPTDELSARSSALTTAIRSSIRELMPGIERCYVQSQTEHGRRDFWSLQGTFYLELELGSSGRANVTQAIEPNFGAGALTAPAQRFLDCVDQTVGDFHIPASLITDGRLLIRYPLMVSPGESPDEI